MRIGRRLLCLVMMLVVSACGVTHPTPPPAHPAQRSASQAAPPVQKTSTPASVAAAPAWHMLPLPAAANEQLSQIDQLQLQPIPGGNALLFTGSPALCCVVAGTVSLATEAVQMLTNPNCGHECGLLPSGSGLFATDQVSGSSCGQIFYRSSAAWTAVARLGMLCAPPPAPSTTIPGVSWSGWTEGVMAAGSSGLWVCLQHNGSTWYLGHIAADGTVTTAQLPGICEAMVSTSSGVLVAIRPSGILSAESTASGAIQLGTLQQLPDTPWTGTFVGFPGTLAVGPQGNLWYLGTSSSGSPLLFRWQPATGTIRSWPASASCEGDYSLAATLGGVWLSIPKVPASHCQASLSFFATSTGSWTPAPGAFATDVPSASQVGSQGELLVLAPIGINALAPDGSTQNLTQGWPSGYTPISVVATTSDGIWVAARSGSGGAYRWVLVQWTDS